LTLEDGTDTLSRSVGNGLPLDVALYPRRAQILTASRRKPEITNYVYLPTSVVTVRHYVQLSDRNSNIAPEFKNKMQQKILRLKKKGLAKTPRLHTTKFIICGKRTSVKNY
jgi:hypothetical protein